MLARKPSLNCELQVQRETLLQINNKVKSDRRRAVWPTHMHKWASVPTCNRGGGGEGERKKRGRQGGREKIDRRKMESTWICFYLSCSTLSVTFMVMC